MFAFYISLGTHAHPRTWSVRKFVCHILSVFFLCFFLFFVFLFVFFLFPWRSAAQRQSVVEEDESSERMCRVKERRRFVLRAVKGVAIPRKATQQANTTRRASCLFLVFLDRSSEWPSRNVRSMVRMSHRQRSMCACARVCTLYARNRHVPERNGNLLLVGKKILGTPGKEVRRTCRSNIYSVPVLLFV